MTLKNFFPHHFLTCRTSDKLTVSITTFIFGKSFANFVCAKMSVVFSILKLNLKHSHNAKQKFNRLASVVNIPQTMQAEFGLSHCCFEDGKNISRFINKCTYIAIVLHITPFVYWRACCRCLCGFCKLPIFTLLWILPGAFLMHVHLLLKAKLQLWTWVQ